MADYRCYNDLCFNGELSDGCTRGSSRGGRSTCCAPATRSSPSAGAKAAAAYLP